MKHLFIEQFLAEVKEFEKDISEAKIFELKEKIDKIFDAVGSRSLIIHDSGTYAMLFIVGPGPIYLHTFFQYKSALKILLSFIEKEEYIFGLKDLNFLAIVEYIAYLKVDINNSYEQFQHFFLKDVEEQERILHSIEHQRKRFSEKGIEKYRGILFQNIDEEISYISSLLKDLKYDKILHLFFGTEREIIEEKITRMLAEKSAEKAVLTLQGQMQQSFNISHLHLEIFRENGFKLFDYLMKNHLSIGSGSQSDIAFYFRKMEYDGLLHAKQIPFKKFLDQLYPELEPIGKMKSFDDVRTEKREQAYRTAKSIMGLK